VKANADKVHTINKYDPEKSSTAKLGNHKYEEKFSFKDRDGESSDVTFTGLGVADDVTFNFQNMLDTTIHTEFLAIDGVQAN